MLAEFSIWPLDEPHMSKEVAQAADLLEQTGVEYHIGPMGTSVSGEWHEVMEAIHACHQAARSAHQRVLTTITIDDDATRARSLQEQAAKVESLRKHEA